MLIFAIFRYNDPPPITTTSIPTSGASLITQIPLVTSPIPALDQGPITLPPRSTVSDPKLPPIPTFSPKELRKQRIRGHKRLQLLNRSFPSFPTKQTPPSSEPQTRFPPKGRPEPENEPEITEQVTTEAVTDASTTQRRVPRVKSNLRLAKKNNLSDRKRLNKSDFTRRFLRNRSRFGANNEQTETTEKFETSTESRLR